MRKTLFIGGLAALTLAAVGGAAVAQQAVAGRARADADGDGRISQVEFVGRRLDRLTAMDADHDGSVTLQERRDAMRVRAADRAGARFERLDTDRDGAISRAEFDAQRPMRMQRVRALRTHGMMARRGQAWMHAAGPVVIADVQARTEQAFMRLDGDHDGFVTVAERQAARHQMRERMVERRAERRARRQASPSAPASE